MPDPHDLHDVNLIPPARLHAKRMKSRLRLWASVSGAYAILVVVAVSSAYALWSEDDRVVRRELEAAALRIRNTTTSVVEARKHLANETAAYQAAQAVEDQPDWSRLLALLAEGLGQDVVLSGCRLQALDDKAGDLMARLDQGQGGAPESLVFGTRQHQLQVTGFGKTRHAVSEFTLRLEKTGLFTVVRCTHSERRPFLDGEAVAFTVECQL